MTPPAPPRAWVLYGCRSSYVAEVVEIIGRRDDTVAALVDNLPEGADAALPRVAATVPRLRAGQLTGELLPMPFVVPLTTPGHRAAAEAEARRLGASDFPPLVDPTAVVAASAELGSGCTVNAASVVAANARLGTSVCVNRASSIGHDDELGDYVTVGPGCTLAGAVRAARGAYFGAGCVVAPGVTIGANAVVGAGAVVVRDVPELAVVVGNPAHVLRVAEAGWNGATVS